jgi:SAM-dependent methyltransferase
MTTAFAYDTVDYPSAALPQADPGHLFAVARMFGLDPAPVERCRYLEVGCGDGTHLLAAAIALPDAMFIGIDLSAVAIERGNRMIAELHLPNVSLYAADLTKWEPPDDGFDYAVAHGLYSWVPAPVRDGLLALLAKCLRPHGVGYVSYNTYPGCYVRRMVWEILRFHTANIPDAARKTHEARELMKFLTAGQPQEPSPMPALFAHELDGLLNDHDPRVLYHDDLGTVNDPVYFHEFAAHAKRFGLRFVAEAEQGSMESRAFPPAVAAVLNKLADHDPLVKEQYLDFLRLRRFRQTLLSTDGGQPRKQPDASRITALWVSGNPKPAEEPVDLAAGTAATFSGARGAAARIDLPIVKAAMVELAARHPGRVAFAELVRLAARRLDREPQPDDAPRLADWLTAVWMAELIALHGHCPRYAEAVSERPVASPLARIQVRTGEFGATLLHESMRFDDPTARKLVQLLDGTRDLDQLVTDLLAEIPPERHPDRAVFRSGVARKLESLAKAGLLVG